MEDWATTSAASVYEYTVGRLFPHELAHAPPSPLQSRAGDGVTHLLDMLCMCREFATPISHMATQLNTTQCESIQFHDRWAVSTDISHVRSTHVHVQGREIVLGGLHLLVFRSKSSDPPSTVIAFRHQEGESLLDNDMWEAMALYGRNFVQLALGPSPLGAIDYGSRAIQALLFGTRHALEMDYFSLAKTLVDELVADDAAPVAFTGYSIGGALGQVMAVHRNTNATVFASNGVLDILAMYHVNAALLGSISTRVVNVMHPRDDVPKLDCQIGTLLLDPDDGRPLDVEAIHAAYVYGDIAWNQLRSASHQRTPGRVWSQSHAYCIDNNLMDSDGFVVDAIAQTTINQVLATFVIGAVILVLVKLLAAWSVRWGGRGHDGRLKP
ncbi:hypothetical protein H310_11420 [Aphanomyces invadans]|uniref:Fungal lipase-like domain-containing protein n=1 Tax=Aphanomyces invadans TaxID=157072 RepID=A0A024TMC5_9STRA|nr:hypothetical protein H310_11420 [Aphanomyces invadans]ETV95154.1 hypothetical protein H310_11420 [Aphanomyces invadans]|eukprot:XP_008876327.1 hypothetical protein H310_11420 [Aphanomyces invadans]